MPPEAYRLTCWRRDRAGQRLGIAHTTEVSAAQLRQDGIVCPECRREWPYTTLTGPGYGEAPQDAPPPQAAPSRPRQGKLAL